METKNILIIIGSMVIGGGVILLLVFFFGVGFLIEKESDVTMKNLEKIGKGANQAIKKINYEARIRREEANKRIIEIERRKERIRLRNEEIKRKEETDPHYMPGNWNIIKNEKKTCYYHKKNKNQVCETVTTE